MQVVMEWIGWSLLAALGSAPVTDVTRHDAKTVSASASDMRAPLAAALPLLSDFHLHGDARQGGVMQGRRPTSVAALALGDIPLMIADDGQFFMAFDRDAPASVHLTMRMQDGRVHSVPISVAPGNWRIEHINAPMRGAAASNADFQNRRPAELAQIQQARAQEMISDGWRQDFIWPVKGRFSGYFGAQRIYQGVAGSYHNGTDIAVPAGTPFVAPADGVVILAAQSPFTLEGNLLLLSHGMGLSSAFLHCQHLDVKQGGVVRQGQVMGTVGATGRASGPHMHWGVMWRGQRLSPASLVQSRDSGG
jgi:hypothetical protein